LTSQDALVILAALAMRGGCVAPLPKGIRLTWGNCRAISPNGWTPWLSVDAMLEMGVFRK